MYFFGRYPLFTYPVVVALSFIGMLSGIFLYSVDFIDKWSTFFILTVNLIWINFNGINRLWICESKLVLVNPIIWCGLITFLMGYGVTNLLFLYPQQETLSSLGLDGSITKSMIILMVGANIGCVGMWVGYFGASNWLSKSGGSLALTNLNKYIWGRGSELKSWILPILITLATIARIVQMKIGIFGYGGDYQQLIEMGQYTFYFTILIMAGKVALILACIEYFKAPNIRKNFFWLLITFSIELIFGILSGFKSAIIMPFLTVMFVGYLKRGKINWLILWVVIASILFAYFVIEPYRQEHNRGSRGKKDGGQSISQNFVNSLGSEKLNVEFVKKATYSIVGRMNFTSIGAPAIDFYENKLLYGGEETPSFLGNIFLSPFQAWIPRLLWPEKPLGNLGVFYHQKVLGHNFISSVGMGPVSYLYLAGGMLPIFLGFLFIGAIQAITWRIFNLNTSCGGIIIFIVIFSILFNIDSSFNGVIVDLFRMPIYAFIFQLFAYKPSDNPIDQFNK